MATEIKEVSKKEPTSKRELRMKQREDKRLADKTARIEAVKAEIEAARVDREKRELEEGFVETPAVKTEREAEEKKILEEASKDRKFEYLKTGSGNAQIDGIIDAVNQIMAHLNGEEFAPEESHFKATDTLYYNETGRTSPDVMGEAAVK